MKKNIILSGIRPTGRLHIGNYLGSLQNFLNLQNTYECYFFIADLHSLNEPYEVKNKQDQIVNLAIDYLSAGLDPEKCTLFIQSHVPQHTELSVILSNVIPSSFLYRMTQFKEKSKDRKEQNINAGLLYYPVLMASDILIYKSNVVPVGDDQTQHVELARDAARFFNNRYGNTFPEPRPLFTSSPRVMSILLPDKKMSKSLGDAHCIYIDDEPNIISKKLSRAVTDTGDGKSLGAKNLIELTKIFCDKNVYENFVHSQMLGKIKYSELKKELSQGIGNYFAHFREKKKYYIKNIEKVRGIFSKGVQKAQKIAGETLEEVKKKIGIHLTL